MLETVFILLYLAVMGAVGIHSAFKIKTCDDFYAAGKSAGTGAVTASLLATVLGSSAILGTIDWSAKVGWASSWMMLCAALGLLVLSPVAGRVRRLGRYTLPDMIGRFYGQEARLLASIVIPAAWTGIIAAQIIGSAKILQAFFSLPYMTGAITSGCVFILYTLLGGQKSVFRTDRLQALLILGGVGATACVLFGKTPSLTELTPLAFPFNTSFSPGDLTVLLLTYGTTFVVGPDIYSRLFCARDEKTASRAAFRAALILIPAGFVFSFLGCYAAHHLPEANAGTALISAFAAALPDWAGALLAAALLSAVMSSADTTLLTASAVSGECFTDLGRHSSIAVTRIGILLIGAISLAIALTVTSIIQSLLIALTIFSGSFFVPVLAGLFGFRTQKWRALAAICAGGACALTGKILALQGAADTGNAFIIAAFAVNAYILFLPSSKK